MVFANRRTVSAVCPLLLAVAAANAGDPLERLKEGNNRFVEGKCEHPNQDADRRARTAERGQHPFATILTCSDSRVAAERIFDAGVGDLFVIRVAGNVADEDEIATIEYGVGHLHAPLLVVMGHSSCGAVKAVAAGAELEGSLPKLVDNIEPAVADARRLSPGGDAKSLLTKAIECNVFQSVADVLRNSEEVKHLVKDRKLRIVGAVYELETGKVRWLGPHPEETRLLGNAHGKAAAKGESHEPAASPEPAAEAEHGKTLVAGHKEVVPPAAHADDDSPTLPPAATILAYLKEGNGRFASATCIHPRCDATRRKDLAKGQHPIATVLTCSDSRLPVEQVFDHGLGDIFTVRVAGNVADTDEIASIEYAVGHLHTPLLVVLGHTACGAVTAVAKNAELGGSLPKLVDNIRPAVEKTRKLNTSLSGDSLIAAAIRANVWQSVEDILTKSKVVRGRVAAGSLEIVGGVYDLSSGKIEWLGPHPEQASLLGPGPKLKAQSPDADSASDSD